MAERIGQTGSNPILHGVMTVEMTLGSVLRYGKGIRCLLTAGKPG